jgi:trans-aconitate methyltransferase
VATRPQWDPEDYRRNSTGQLAWARELIAKLQLRGDERVLDLGCGDGKVTAEIAAAVTQGSVVGIDSAPGMIELASRLFPAGEHPNLAFRLMDARELDLPAEYDVVFSNAVLHWVLDHGPVLRGIARSLMPGGRCLLQMGGRGNGAEVLAVLDELAALPEWAPYLAGMGQVYGFYGPDDYAPWLAEVGLVALRLELLPKDMVHEGAAGLAGWIRSTWLPYTQRVPEGQREEFIAALVHGYLARHPADADGKVHVAMVRLEVAAERRA